MKTENIEIQNAENETEIILNNQFIQNCNEIGISRFEEMMGITPQENDDLETRINKVLIRWNNTIPYTYKLFDNKLKILCGENNYSIKMNPKEYTILIKVNTDIMKKIEEIQFLIEYMIPANMKTTIELFKHEEKTFYLGVITRQERTIKMKGGL
jgi:hypothetical protein